MKTFNRMSLLIIVSTLFIASSCTEDVKYENPIPKNIRVLIVNEGQYGKGTASLTAISADKTATNDLFRSINNRPLGDAALSITEIGDNYYIASLGKIEVINKKTLLSTATILTGKTPSYMVDLGNGMMGVSNKWSGKYEDNGDPIWDDNLTLVDLKTNKVTSIAAIGGTSQMKVIDKKLFLSGGTSLRVLGKDNISGTAMSEIKDMRGESIATAENAKIVTDKKGRICVLSPEITNWKTGEVTQIGKLICIENEAVIREITIENISSDTFARMDISPDGENLYFTGMINGSNGVFKMGIDDSSTPTHPLFTCSRDGRILYGMSVSPEGTIFVSDLIFTPISRGSVYEYSATGTLVNTIEAGLFPSFFFFTEAK